MQPPNEHPPWAPGFPMAAFPPGLAAGMPLGGAAAPVAGAAPPPMPMLHDQIMAQMAFMSNINFLSQVFGHSAGVDPAAGAAHAAAAMGAMPAPSPAAVAHMMQLMMMQGMLPGMMPAMMMPAPYGMPAPAPPARPQQAHTSTPTSSPPAARPPMYAPGIASATTTTVSSRAMPAPRAAARGQPRPAAPEPPAQPLRARPAAGTRGPGRPPGVPRATAPRPAAPAPAPTARAAPAAAPHPPRGAAGRTSKPLPATVASASAAAAVPLAYSSAFLTADLPVVSCTRPTDMWPPMHAPAALPPGVVPLGAKATAQYNWGATVKVQADSGIHNDSMKGMVNLHQVKAARAQGQGMPALQAAVKLAPPSWPYVALATPSLLDYTVESVSLCTAVQAAAVLFPPFHALLACVADAPSQIGTEATPGSRPPSSATVVDVPRLKSVLQELRKLVEPRTFPDVLTIRILQQAQDAQRGVHLGDPCRVEAHPIAVPKASLEGEDKLSHTARFDAPPAHAAWHAAMRAFLAVDPADVIRAASERPSEEDAAALGFTPDDREHLCRMLGGVTRSSMYACMRMHRTLHDPFIRLRNERVGAWEAREDVYMLLLETTARWILAEIATWEHMHARTSPAAESSSSVIEEVTIDAPDAEVVYLDGTDPEPAVADALLSMLTSMPPPSTDDADAHDAARFHVLQDAADMALTDPQAMEDAIMRVEASPSYEPDLDDVTGRLCALRDDFRAALRVRAAMVTRMMTADGAHVTNALNVIDTACGKGSATLTELRAHQVRIRTPAPTGGAVARTAAKAANKNAELNLLPDRQQRRSSIRATQAQLGLPRFFSDDQQRRGFWRAPTSTAATSTVPTAGGVVTSANAAAVVLPAAAPITVVSTTVAPKTAAPSTSDRSATPSRAAGRVFQTRGAAVAQPEEEDTSDDISGDGGDRDEDGPGARKTGRRGPPALSRGHALIASMVQAASERVHKNDPRPRSPPAPPQAQQAASAPRAKRGLQSAAGGAAAGLRRNASMPHVPRDVAATLSSFQWTLPAGVASGGAAPAAPAAPPLAPHDEDHGLDAPVNFSREVMETHRSKTLIMSHLELVEGMVHVNVRSFEDFYREGQFQCPFPAFGEVLPSMLRAALRALRRRLEKKPPQADEQWTDALYPESVEPLTTEVRALMHIVSSCSIKGRCSTSLGTAEGVRVHAFSEMHAPERQLFSINFQKKWNALRSPAECKSGLEAYEKLTEQQRARLAIHMAAPRPTNATTVASSSVRAAAALLSTPVPWPLGVHVNSLGAAGVAAARALQHAAGTDSTSSSGVTSLGADVITELPLEARTALHLVASAQRRQAFDHALTTAHETALAWKLLHEASPVAVLATKHIHLLGGAAAEVVHPEPRRAPADVQPADAEMREDGSVSESDSDATDEALYEIFPPDERASPLPYSLISRPLNMNQYYPIAVAPAQRVLKRAKMAVSAGAVTTAAESDDNVMELVDDVSDGSTAAAVDASPSSPVRVHVTLVDKTCAACTAFTSGGVETCDTCGADLPQFTLPALKRTVHNARQRHHARIMQRGASAGGSDAGASTAPVDDSADAVTAALQRGPISIAKHASSILGGAGTAGVKRRREDAHTTH